MNTHEELANNILPALIEGKSQREVADKAGVSQPTITRLKKKLKPLIELGQLKIYNDTIDLVHQNTVLTLMRANEVLNDKSIKNKDISEYKDIVNIAHKKEMCLAQGMGILPSHTQSIVIENLFMAQQMVISNPTVQAAITKYAADDDVLDVDIGSFEEGI